MAVYSELIKSFDKVRDYVRDFYIFGFRTREDYNTKSKRTYDNEKRRIESWLSDYVHTELSGHKKKVAVKIDCSRIYRNPLYKCFKSATYTENDIKLHFIIMDILENREMTASEITDKIVSEYGMVFDLQTVRLKLKEYADEGLIIQNKIGKSVVFRKSDVYIDNILAKYPALSDMISFFSEEIPFGVVGSFIMDKADMINSIFTRKHAYMVHTLDDEILLEVCQAMKEKREVNMSLVSLKNGNKINSTAIPLKIHSSVQTGRNYLIMYNEPQKRLFSARLDSIKSVKIGEVCDEYDRYYEFYQNNECYLWGTSFGKERKHGQTEHIHMEILIDENKEQFILKRLEREGRNGTITKLEDGRYAYDADVFDANEMSPWIKTFIGRIAAFDTTNTDLKDKFYNDIQRLYDMYGGDEG
ncbi:MAG: WYL domain-containing protein [Oscillospiraceae bacterium]